MKERVYKCRILLYMLFCGVVLSVSGTGCTGEEIPVPVPPPAEEKETITLYFRDAGKPATRALNDSLEKVVRTVDVLAFKRSYNELVYAYHKAVDETDIHPATDDFSKKEFTITVDKDHEKYQYVILANARAEVSTCLSQGNLVGELKETLLPNLISESPLAWDVSTAFRPIPMWGETEKEGQTIEQLNGKVIALYRSLARVDVKISTPSFILQKIYVYNRPSSGRLIPEPANWDADQKRSVSPSLPSNLVIVDKPGTTTPVPYLVQNNGSTHEIYLYETKELGTQDFLDATCLVLGGTYNNATYYYRVDFAQMPEPVSPPIYGDPNGPPTEDTGTGGMVGSGDSYHPILRNHHYELNITGVKGEGLSSPELAVSSINSQLISDFITWDNANQNVIIDGGQYEFNVTPAELILKNPDGMIFLSTTYPGAGWSLDEPDVDWFECQIQSGGNMILVNIPSDLPPVGSVGYFKVKLMDGNVRKVTQQIKVEYNPNK